MKAHELKPSDVILCDGHKHVVREVKPSKIAGYVDIATLCWTGVYRTSGGILCQRNTEYAAATMTETEQRQIDYAIAQRAKYGIE